MGRASIEALQNLANMLVVAETGIALRTQEAKEELEEGREERRDERFKLQLAETKRHNLAMEVLADNKFDYMKEQDDEDFVNEHGQDNVTYVGIFDENNNFIEERLIQNDRKQHRIKDPKGSGNWITVTLPAYDHSKTKEGINTTMGSNQSFILDQQKVFPGVSQYLVDDEGNELNQTDKIALINDYSLYKNLGLNFSGGTIIDEDLYRDYDQSYAGLGKLYAFDQDTPGYLGLNDVEQARQWMGTFISDLDTSGPLLDDDEAVLRDWGILDAGEIWIDQPATQEEIANNNSLKSKLEYRSTAFLEGITEPGPNGNLEFFTETKRNEWLNDQKYQELLIAEGITGSKIVQDIKDSYVNSLNAVNGGIVSALSEDGERFLLSTNKDMSLLNIFEAENIDKIESLTNKDTARLISKIATTGITETDLEDMTKSIGANGKLILGSRLYNIAEGLTELGLSGARLEIINAVQKRGKYRAFMDGGTGYVKGSVDDPDKLTYRSSMVLDLDSFVQFVGPGEKFEEHNGKTIREVILTGSQKEATDMISHLELEQNWTDIPKKYRDEFYGLMWAEREAFQALGTVGGTP